MEKEYIIRYEVSKACCRLALFRSKEKALELAKEKEASVFKHIYKRSLDGSRYYHKGYTQIY